MAEWARKVLKFSEKSAQTLIDQDCNGQTLLDISSLDELKNFNLPLGAAIRMWAAIEKMKKAQADPGTCTNTIFYADLVIDRSMILADVEIVTSEFGQMSLDKETYGKCAYFYMIYREYINY